MELTLKKGDDIEVSSDEEGFRGAWFSAKVIDKLRGGFYMVEYRDLMTDEDETKPLAEKVKAVYVRPTPSLFPESQPHQTHEFLLYEEVDAFDNDGWWVGVVTEKKGDGFYIVYFMQSKEKTQFHHSQLRPHLDFIDSKWVQPSKALLESYSVDEDRENGDDTIMPYIFCQIAGTRKLTNPILSADKEAEDNDSKSGRSLKCTEKPTNSSSSKGMLEVGSQVDGLPVARKYLNRRSAKRKQGTQGHLDNSSSTIMKKTRQEIIELEVETLEVSPPENRKQESHWTSASPPTFDEGIHVAASNIHLEEINHDRSLLGKKTKKELRQRRNQRKSSSQFNNISACITRKENMRGTVADAMKTSEDMIGLNGKHKTCLNSCSSPHSSNAINFIISDAHNVQPTVNTINMDSQYISSWSLKPEEQEKKSMVHGTNHPKGYGITGMENTRPCIPSSSPDRGEKTYTVTIPHLEYVRNGRVSLRLRELNLLAYRSVLQALFLQGVHTWNHEVLLTNLREELSITNEEHSVQLKHITTAKYD